MNETAAKEWLTKAWHDLSAAALLLRHRHYTDTIAVEIHYAVEKSLKSLLAYKNVKIPKTHHLVELALYCEEDMVFDEEETMYLSDISTYHIQETYPVFERSALPYEEVEQALHFANDVFERVCRVLNIPSKTIKKEPR